MQIATIPNAKANQDIQNVYKTSGCGGYAYVGANRPTKADAWRWDDGTPFAFWSPGPLEMDGFFFTHESRLVVADNALWYDWGVGAALHHVVC